MDGFCAPFAIYRVYETQGVAQHTHLMATLALPPLAYPELEPFSPPPSGLLEDKLFSSSSVLSPGFTFRFLAASFYSSYCSNKIN